MPLPTYECLRCGHKWHPRSDRRPDRCPKCNSPYWDRPRKGSDTPITVDHLKYDSHSKSIPRHSTVFSDICKGEKR